MHFTVRFLPKLKGWFWTPVILRTAFWIVGKISEISRNLDENLQLLLVSCKIDVCAHKHASTSILSEIQTFWKKSPRFLEISLIFPRIQKSARSMREVKKHPWQNQPKPFPKLCNFGVRGLMVLDHKMSASEARMVDAHENVSTFGSYSTSCVRI